MCICITTEKDRQPRSLLLDYAGDGIPEGLSFFKGPTGVWRSSSDQNASPGVNLELCNDVVRRRCDNAHILWRNHWAVLPCWDCFGDPQLDSILPSLCGSVAVDMVMCIVGSSDMLVSRFLDSNNNTVGLFKLLHEYKLARD